MAEVFAHEPCVTRDPRTGELLMVSVNQPISGPFANVSLFNASSVCTCTPNCTRSSRHQCQVNCTSGSRRSFLPIIRTAPGVDGQVSLVTCLVTCLVTSLVTCLDTCLTWVSAIAPVWQWSESYIGPATLVVQLYIIYMYHTAAARTLCYMLDLGARFLLCLTWGHGFCYA